MHETTGEHACQRHTDEPRGRRPSVPPIGVLRRRGGSAAASRRHRGGVPVVTDALHSAMDVHSDGRWFAAEDSGDLRVREAVHMVQVRGDPLPFRESGEHLEDPSHSDRVGRGCLRHRRRPPRSDVLFLVRPRVVEDDEGAVRGTSEVTLDQAVDDGEQPGSRLSDIVPETDGHQERVLDGPLAVEFR
ncbi:hypothetical protein J3A78_007620 [Streptomyces sp. PvR006]|nr:hypothetical protein [Streptomyces sp. PvR006]MBP2587142.1 hypothetical protein [Streptomyces sp. PvR006]